MSKHDFLYEIDKTKIILRIGFVIAILVVISACTLFRNEIISVATEVSSLMTTNIVEQEPTNQDDISENIATAQTQPENVDFKASQMTQESHSPENIISANRLAIVQPNIKRKQTPKADTSPMDIDEALLEPTQSNLVGNGGNIDMALM